MRALVIGYGISGRAAAALLRKQGAEVVAVDSNPPSDVPDVLIDTTTFPMGEFDSVVLSPGIPPDHPLVIAARKVGTETIGEAELALRFLPGRKLGITGTNGKTTVTLLTAHILQQYGFNARAVGNIGAPLSAQLDDPADIFVVELSSYQLETMHSPVLDAGVILNITPDHLDRYSSMEAYAAAKYNLRHCIKPGGAFFVHESLQPPFDGYETYGFGSNNDLYYDGEHLLYKEIIEYYLPKEYREVGSPSYQRTTVHASHDVLNIMASYALCREWLADTDRLDGAIDSFQKPPHRMEHVQIVDGVHYINDSKGTNLDAVMCAVKALPGPVILIAGGVDKGAAYTPWIECFKGRVESIVAIGEAAPKIAEQLGAHMPVTLCPTLESAVNSAKAMAKPGAYVLLSPGCSSFDMFQNYEHRGDTFKKIINDLIEEEVEV